MQRSYNTPVHGSQDLQNARPVPALKRSDRAGISNQHPNARFAAPMPGLLDQSGFAVRPRLRRQRSTSQSEIITVLSERSRVSKTVTGSAEGLEIQPDGVSRWLSFRRSARWDGNA